MQNKHYRGLFSTLLLLLLSSCAGGSGKAIRYYLIDPVNFGSQSQSTDKPLSIEITDLAIPQYLERFQIATRASAGRLAFSDYHQWGESLRKNLLRTTARNLSQLLATHDVGTPLNRSASQPDYRLQIYLEQFELDVDNRVKLMARWQLIATDSQKQPAQRTQAHLPVSIFATELRGDKTISDGDYDQMVAQMRELFGQLSREMASSIQTQQN